MSGSRILARAPLALLALLVALTGCGDDDGEAREEGATAAGPEVSAIERNIEEQLGGPSVSGDPQSFTVESVSCPDDAVVAAGEEFECEAATSEGDVPVAVTLGQTYSYTGMIGTTGVGGTLNVEAPDLAAIEEELVSAFADNDPDAEVDCPDDADLDGEFKCEVTPDGEVTVTGGVSLDWSTTIAGESHAGGAQPLE